MADNSTSHQEQPDGIPPIDGNTDHPPSFGGHSLKDEQSKLLEILEAACEKYKEARDNFDRVVAYRNQTEFLNCLYARERAIQNNKRVEDARKAMMIAERNTRIALKNIVETLTETYADALDDPRYDPIRITLSEVLTGYHFTPGPKAEVRVAPKAAGGGLAQPVTDMAPAAAAGGGLAPPVTDMAPAAAAVAESDY